jgi:hypothetical protein
LYEYRLHTTGGPAATWRRPGRILLLICLLAAVPRLYFAAMYPLNYDEYWHVFVARQDTRDALAAEWRSTVHPPLYFGLLKLSLLLGSNRLVYRLVSLLAGIAAVFVIGRIVQKLARSPVVPYLAALTFAFAPPAVITSFEARSYMLSSFFMLAAFAFYLPMLDNPSCGRIFCFSVLCCLALVSNYSAAFFLLACLGSLVYVSALRWAGEGRLPAVVRERPASLAVGLLLPLATMAVLYREHVRWVARGRGQLMHLPAFHYRPVTGESLFAYLIRALHNEYNLVLPVRLGNAAAIPIFIFTLIVLTGALGYLLRRRGELSRRLPYLFVILIAGGLLAASVRGVYPFGGMRRQQFILFPFLVIAGFLLIDGAMSRWRGLRVPVAILALTVGCLSGLWHIRWEEHGTVQDKDDPIPPLGAELCIRQMNVYLEAFPTPQLVYTDPPGLIVFFAHHDRWQWRAGPRGWRDGRLDRYEITHDGQRVVVLRERLRRIDLGDERTYRDLAWSLRSLVLESGTVFSLQHREPFYGPAYGPDGEKGDGLCGEVGSRPADETERRRRVTALATDHHLETGRLIFDGPDFFGEFRARR